MIRTFARLTFVSYARAKYESERSKRTNLEQRNTKMTPSDYIENLPMPQRLIADELRALILSLDAPITEAIKWRMPVFTAKRNLFSIGSFKHHVNLHIFNGSALQDDDGVLKGSGKEMRHLQYHTPDDVDSEDILPFLMQALKLDLER